MRELPEQISVSSFGTLVLSAFVITDFVVRSVSFVAFVAAIEGYNGNVDVSAVFLVLVVLLIAFRIAFEAYLLYYISEQSVYETRMRFVALNAFPNAMSITPALFSCFGVYPYRHHSEWSKLLRTQYLHLLMSVGTWIATCVWRPVFEYYPRLYPFLLVNVFINLMLTVFVQRYFEAPKVKDNRSTTAESQTEVYIRSNIIFD